MRTYWQVRFVCYQYNCGGSSGNGLRRCHENFDTYEKALLFAKQVKGYIANHKKLLGEEEDDVERRRVSYQANEVARRYVVDGYFESYDGIYVIKEVRCAE